MTKTKSSSKDWSSNELRLKKLDGLNDCVLISDGSVSDMDSIEKALKTLLIHSKNKNYTVILGDFRYSEEDSETALAELLEKYSISKFIAIGESIGDHPEAFKGMKSHFYSDIDSFIRDVQGAHFNSETILIKAGHNPETERIVTALAEKSHETVLEIDLAKIAQNLKVIKAKLKSETKIMVMVKAFAYGNTGYDIARFLEHEEVEYLAVAYTDEGIELRKSGIKMPIMVLNPEIAGYGALIKHNLEPQLYSFRTLKSFVGALTNSGVKGAYPVHIKLNTGMNRLGFNPEEINALKSFLRENHQLEIKSVFSHLAGSDDAKLDGLTKKQLDRFKAMSEALEIPEAMRHILNSSGILRHPEAQYDMVRLGLALYGFSSNPRFKPELIPVSRLITKISQIRMVEPGEGIGYSPAEFLKEPHKIGIIPMGYADGLPRKLGNGKGQVFVNGSFVPFIGNICMDMAMIDLTHADAEEGDIVEIFGEFSSVYKLAEKLETIPYEVLTSISQRVKRIFLQK